MRRSVILIVAFSLVVACGGGGGGAAETGPGAASPNSAAKPADVVTLVKSPESGQVDRVGPADGALTPDGAKDLAFIIEADGPIASIYLVAIDERGSATGQFQADTLVGDTEVPKDVSIKWGKGTAGLGVFEGDKLLNAPDGSLSPIGAGHHKLALYTSAAPTVKAGMKLRVYLQRPDKTVVTGATITYE